MEELRGSGKWQEARLKDLEFHKRLIALSASSQLKAAVNSSQMVVLSWNRAMDAQQRVADCERSCREHRIIIEHIRLGEAEQAVEVLTDHLRGGLADTMRAAALAPDELVSPDPVGDLAQGGDEKMPLRLKPDEQVSHSEAELPISGDGALSAHDGTTPGSS